MAGEAGMGRHGVAASADAAGTLLGATRAPFPHLRCVPVRPTLVEQIVNGEP